MIFEAFSSATSSAITKTGLLVTSSASATASSTISQNEANKIAKFLALQIGEQTAQHDANIIDQSADLEYIDNLPDEIINPLLNLSFRDIGIKLNGLLQYLITTLYPTSLYQEIIQNTTQDSENISTIISVLRRLFSNFVNNPSNITDRDGNYIGDKYGLRILYCSNDGYVNADVETFCKNVAVKPYKGVKNNYLVYYINPQPVTNLPNLITENSSKIDLSKTDKIPTQLNVLKCKSSELPKSNDEENLIYNIFGPSPEYEVIPETPPTNIFDNLQIIDNHSSRIEIQKSRLSDYGYASRRSDTTSLFNWYVAKNLGSNFLSNPGTSFTLRISFFEW